MQPSSAFLSVEHLNKVMGDSKFLAQHPCYAKLVGEYNNLSAHAKDTSCKDCSESKAMNGVLATFLQIVNGLSTTEMRSLKLFLGLDSLSVHYRDADTRELICNTF